MLKTSKDTFWKVMLLILCKVLKGYKWTFPMVTALKHTSVTNIFTTQEFKTFFCWSEAFSKLGSCLLEICKVLSSPSPLRGYCGTSLSTWPLWNQAFHSGEGGLRVIVLAMVFFCTEVEILFYFAARDWSQSEMGIPLGLHSWFNATHKNPVV